MKWRIVWRSKLTGYEGHGEFCLSRRDAMEHVKTLNRDWPEAVHWWEVES